MEVVRHKIANSAILESTPFRDGRGAFEVFWEASAQAAGSISISPESAFHSYNPAVHTLRGMHYQDQPHAQARLVSCVRGCVWDVIVDLRPDSATFLGWQAVELIEGCGRAVYVPRGCAHGFLTLAENSTVAYLIEGRYVPESAKTLRWDDPAVAIEWPLPAQVQPLLSARDSSAPDFRK